MGLHGINLTLSAPIMQSESITSTKKELVQRIAEDTGQTKSVVRKVVQTFLDTIIDDLAQGKRIEFREFGIFEIKHREARTARNPRTNDPVEVPAQRLVKFKPGSRMREQIAGQGEGKPAATKKVRPDVQTSRPATRPASEPPKAPPPTSPDSPF
jgi:integration host factor subunit beta